MRTAFALLLALLVLAATRLPVAPRYLYHFDSVNFALSINDFNPALHQPQPPGYPLFVGLLKLTYLVIPTAEHALIAAGLLLGAAAMLFLWLLAAELFGRAAGILAVALLVCNPAFWMGGVTNPVRIGLAFCSAGVAYLAWRALQNPSDSSRLYLAFAALGLADGFRPSLGILLAPLLLWVWWRTGHSVRRLLFGCVCTIVAMIPWMAATAVAVGGFESWVELMWNYAKEQFGGSSAVFGAPTTPAWRMATYAIIWNGMGTLAWIWAVPFLRARRDDALLRDRGLFLAVWAGPIFLFSLLIHIGDPDQALGSIPAFCVAGGFVLAAFARRFERQPIALLAFVAAGLNAAVFFFPPGGVARASSYSTISGNDRLTGAVIEAIQELQGAEPLTIVHHNAQVSWRHLFYYFPDDYVMFLPATVHEQGWTLHKRARVEQGAIPPGTLPETQRVVLVGSPSVIEAARAEAWQQKGPVLYKDVQGDLTIKVGPYGLSHPNPKNP